MERDQITAEGGTGFLNASNEIPSKICCFQFWAVSQQKGTDKSGRIQGETSRYSVGLERVIGEGGKKSNIDNKEPEKTRLSACWV